MERAYIGHWRYFKFWQHQSGWSIMWWRRVLVWSDGRFRITRLRDARKKYGGQ